MSGKTWKASSLAHISGKDKRYSPISERTMNRRLKKFAVGGNAGGHGHRPENDYDEDEDDAGLLRSPTASSRSQTAASAGRNGFVEETSYDELEAGRPVRVNAPSFLDVPARLPRPPADDALMQRLFTPAAHRDTKRGVKRISGPDQMARLKDTTDGFAFKSQLADAQVLATASRRAGDGPGECLAFFRLALLQDNLNAHRNAISAYKKYLAACERMGDTPGAAMALNCIGVNLQLMANAENRPDRRQRMLQSALSYHQRHFEIADTRSQFVAKNNSGLVLAASGDFEGAGTAFQEALKYALILKAPREQSVAFGNLAQASFDGGNMEQARQYLDQQLTMLEDIAGTEEEAARAHLLLGRAASADGDHQDAQEHSEQARKLAVAAGASALASVAKCFIGANLARSMIDDVLHETANEIAAAGR